MFVLVSSTNKEDTLLTTLNFDRIENKFSAIYSYFNPVNGAVLYSLKLSIALLGLLLMRGGTPRYRYDYLTKLG
jgi:NADH:ubiquinone oxidoreductase subunit H